MGAIVLTLQDLKVAATESLAKAFAGNDVPVHVVQAAIAVLQMQG